MNERLKILRQHLKLTQEEFGQKLGVTRSAISYLESGRNHLTDQMIFTICLRYDVRKEWLETGMGNMFMTHTVSEELSGYLGKLLSENNPQKEKYALLALKLIVDDWELIEKNVNKFIDITAWISNRAKESEMI